MYFSSIQHEFLCPYNIIIFLLATCSTVYTVELLLVTIEISLLYTCFPFYEGRKTNNKLPLYYIQNNNVPLYSSSSSMSFFFLFSFTIRYVGHWFLYTGNATYTFSSPSAFDSHCSPFLEDAPTTILSSQQFINYQSIFSIHVGSQSCPGAKLWKIAKP